MIDGSQVCSTCKELKPVSEFYKSNQCKNGLVKFCKSCASKYKKERRLQGKEKRYYIKKKVPKFKIGQKINKLTIQQIIISGKLNKTSYLCICDCGNTKTVSSAWMLKKTLSCGCLKKKENNNMWSGYGAISGTLFGKAKSSALKRNMDFNLTIVDLHNLYEKQNGKCALTGEVLEFGTGFSKRGVYITASLDRIDSSKGYTIDNVQWVHKDVNMMKRNYDNDYFKYICYLVAKHEQDTE